MDASLNLRHWDALAEAFGADLRATTKCRTIKVLELDALGRALARFSSGAVRVLEVGCGPAVNGLALCRMFPSMQWTGCDAVARMVDNATRAIGEQPGAVAARMEVLTAAAPELGPLAGRCFDAVYTDRCLINLPSLEAQVAAARRIAELLPPGAPFLMLENSRQTHARLNEARRALGLPLRPPPDYNLFIDEDAFLPRVADLFRLEAVDDFGSLHDLLLYAIKPAASGDGAIVYDDAVMNAATTLSLALAADGGAGFGSFGQNRLWRFRRLPE